MQEINIQGTFDTPAVKFDVVNGVFDFSGRSLPENVVKFYDPILRWLDEAHKLPNDTIEVRFRFKYFNTASSKMILEILDRLLKLDFAGKKIIIKWYYLNVDEDMKDEGEYFSEMIGMPFEFVETQKNNINN